MPLAGVRPEQPGAVGKSTARCIAGRQKSRIVVMVGGIVRVAVEHVVQVFGLRMGSVRMGMIVPRGFFFM